MTPEKGLDYHCNRTPTPTPWHFEDSVEKVEEGVKVETWFSNGQGSYLDTQVDLSDQGASDVTLPSKKKRRRVLFSKVGLPGSSCFVHSCPSNSSFWADSISATPVKTKIKLCPGSDLRVGTSVSPAALLDRL